MLSSCYSFAQDRYAYLLHEKVRKPELVEYLLELNKHNDNYSKHGISIPEDFPTIGTFLNELKKTHNKKSASSNEEMNGAEPFIVVDHNNPNIVIASYISEVLNDTMFFPVYHSDDGGISWNKSSFNTLSVIQNQIEGVIVLGGGDPVLAIDNNVRVHMTYIYAHSTASDTYSYFYIYYCYSDDGGENWIVPSQNRMPHDGLDRQWMAVDNSSGSDEGKLYLSAALFFTDEVGQYVVSKQAQSDVFDSTIVLAVPTNQEEDHTQYGNIKVDNNGYVHLSCLRYNDVSNSGSVVYVKSTDGGQTFQEPVIIASASTAQVVNAKIHSRENTATSLAVDNDNVYVCWTDFSDNDIKSYYSYSNNNGSTFSSPIEIGSQISEDTAFYYFMPFICADDGKMVISYCKIDKQSNSSEYYFMSSLDSGLTLSTPQLLSSQEFNHTNDLNAFYGDYNTSDMIGCEVFFSWAESSSIENSTTIYFEKRNICDGVNISEISPITNQFSLGKIYPNPIGERRSVDIITKETDRFNVRVLNSVGRVVIDLKNVNYSAGKHTFSFDVSSLAKGHYVFTLNTKNGLFATRPFTVH